MRTCPVTSSQTTVRLTFMNSSQHDSDEVIRDYYVYLHKDPINGVPFYVGKGRGDRAYSKARRHPEWHAKVGSLKGDYVVEIVTNALLEREAFHEEAELIRKYGKVSDGTGTLVNWTDGGENELGNIGISVEVPGLKESYDATDSITLRGKERTQFADDLIQCISEAEDEIEHIASVHEEDESCESISALCLRSLSDEADNFRRKKISCKDIAFQIDEAVAYLESSEEEDLPNPKVLGVAKRFSAQLSEIRSRIGKRRAPPKPLTEEERIATIRSLEEALEKIRKMQRKEGS